jgi:hypothetical protein
MVKSLSKNHDPGSLSLRERVRVRAGRREIRHNWPNYMLLSRRERGGYWDRL